MIKSLSKTYLLSLSRYLCTSQISIPCRFPDSNEHSESSDQSETSIMRKCAFSCWPN